jgi:hypothetical protein
MKNLPPPIAVYGGGFLLPAGLIADQGRQMSGKIDPSSNANG